MDPGGKYGKVKQEQEYKQGESGEPGIRPRIDWIICLLYTRAFGHVLAGRTGCTQGDCLAGLSYLSCTFNAAYVKELKSHVQNYWTAQQLHIF